MGTVRHYVFEVCGYITSKSEEEKAVWLIWAETQCTQSFYQKTVESQHQTRSVSISSRAWIRSIMFSPAERHLGLRFLRRFCVVGFLPLEVDMNSWKIRPCIQPRWKRLLCKISVGIYCSHTVCRAMRLLYVLVFVRGTLMYQIVIHPVLKFWPGIPLETRIHTEPSGKHVMSQLEFPRWLVLAWF